jgi:hypothetical protein
LEIVGESHNENVSSRHETGVPVEPAQRVLFFELKAVHQPYGQKSFHDGVGHHEVKRFGFDDSEDEEKGDQPC